MKIKVVNVEENVTVKYQDTIYKGRRLHYTFVASNGGIGCGNQFLNDDKFANVILTPSKSYWCDRNYGKLQSFEEIKNDQE